LEKPRAFIKTDYVPAGIVALGLSFDTDRFSCPTNTKGSVRAVYVYGGQAGICALPSVAGAHCASDAVRKSFPTIFVEPVLIPAQAINKNAPTSGASLFMAERQGYAPCPPWPARIAPADRCPNLLHANSSNGSHPCLMSINTKGPVRGLLCLWRRGRDSNPGTPVKMLLEFQSSAFDRSATSPETFVRSTKSLVEGDSDWNRPARYSARPVLRPCGADCRVLLAIVQVRSQRT
jgi:hypothetical protein